MQILFQHNFEFPVWRIISSSTQVPSWVVELRNASNQTVEYHFIDQEFKVKRLKPTLNWWSGVECVLGSTVLFHGYQQQDLPIHKGITAFDPFSNQIIWENDFLSFISANTSFIKVKVNAGSLDATVVLELKSGEETDNLLTEDTFPSLQTNIIAQGQPYFNEISGFIKKIHPFRTSQSLRICRGRKSYYCILLYNERR